MNRYITIFYTLSVLIISGCNTNPPTGASAIQDADEQTVADCELIGPVDGASSPAGIGGALSMNGARHASRQQAASLGATHIVWLRVSGGYVPQATGNAYRCNK